MICNECRGSGVVVQNVFDGATKTMHSRFVRYCITCGGSGIAHCCDGDRACEDTPDVDSNSKEL